MAKTVVVYKKIGADGTMYICNGRAYPSGKNTSSYSFALDVSKDRLFDVEDEWFFIEGVHEPEELEIDYYKYDPTPIATFTFD